MTSRGIIKIALAATCASVLSLSAQAAQVTLYGDTINYVYDDSQAAMAYFGAPSIVGDVVVFTPTTFSALSQNGAGTVMTTSTFQFDSVYHKDGLALANMTVSEQGDYFIDGTGEVSVDLYLQGVTNPGGGTLGSGVSQASFSTSADTSGALTLWGPLEGSLDIGAFSSPPFLGGTPSGDQTDIKVTIQNTLRAESTGTSDAFIQKKLNFSVAAVPVPAAVWLFGSAVLGLLAVGRRKAAATA